MPFVRLADRIPTKRKGFYFSITPKGVICIMIDPDHELVKSKKVLTEIGTGPEEGLLLLLASDTQEGRSVNVNNQGKGWNVRYKTLPGCDTSKPIKAKLKTRPYAGGVILEMPWYNKVAGPVVSTHISQFDARASVTSVARQPDFIHNKVVEVKPKPQNSTAANFSLRKAGT